MLGNTHKNSREYYKYLTSNYRKYSGRSQGWHYGITINKSDSHIDSLINSNIHLTQNLNLNENSKILDLGCGIGGLCTWIAKKYNCEVIGVSNVPQHIRAAQEMSRNQNLAHLCQFICKDFEKIELKKNYFDLVITQESFCHVVNKDSFIKNIFRVLRENGVWRSQFFSKIPNYPQTKSDKNRYNKILDGFHISPLLSFSQIKDITESTKFKKVEISDITKYTVPTAKKIIRSSILPLFLMRLKINSLDLRFPQYVQKLKKGHYSAGYYYSEGLMKGHFKHGLLTALK